MPGNTDPTNPNDLADLSTLADLPGDAAELTAGQLRAIVGQIDLDIVNLLRDGKLSALKYAAPGDSGGLTDRAANLKALLEARRYYAGLLDGRGGWAVTAVEVIRERRAA